MAAVITAPHYTPAPRPVERPRHLRPVPDRSPSRRASVVRPSAAVLRRRRLVAAIAVLALAALLITGAVSAIRAVTGVGGAAVPASPAASAPVAGQPAVAGPTYVVRAGDTLWSIARRLDRGGDVRAVVDALVDRTGGAELRPGQVIDLDGLG